MRTGLIALLLMLLVASSASAQQIDDQTDAQLKSGERKLWIGMALIVGGCADHALDRKWSYREESGSRQRSDDRRWVWCGRGWNLAGVVWFSPTAQSGGTPHRAGRRRRSADGCDLSANLVRAEPYPPIASTASRLAPAGSGKLS